MSKRSRSASTISTYSGSPIDTPSRSVSVEANEHATKYAQLDDHQPSSAAMRCLLPPHRSMSFSSYAEYETHYSQSHSNRCSDCQHNFPTAHFLELHIAENHDPIVAARRERGEKTYACFVEGCDKACMDWKKRRSHLVDKHAFPRNYDFFVVNTGVDGKRSMLRPGVDAQGHRASSRERNGSDALSAMESTSTPSAGSASMSPQPPTAAPKTRGAVSQPVTGASSSTAASDKATWRGKRRASSLRGPAPGAPLAPAKDGMDDIISSMSALKMVPRSVAASQRKPQASNAKN